MEKFSQSHQEIGDFFKSYIIPDIISVSSDTNLTPAARVEEADTTIKSPSPKSNKTTNSKKRKRTDSNEHPLPRTVFSTHQIEALESRFREQSFLSKEERQELALMLSLTERQVMIWFQNRRGRLKKRGPLDKAYNPSKLQEINIRRPYPFLCGVLTNGQRYQPGQPLQMFSMYPREVQTHIQKVASNLPSQELGTLNQLTSETTGEVHTYTQNVATQLSSQDRVNQHTIETNGSPPQNRQSPTHRSPNGLNHVTGKSPLPNVSVYNVENNVHETTRSPSDFNKAADHQNVMSEEILSKQNNNHSGSLNGYYYHHPSKNSTCRENYPSENITNANQSGNTYSLTSLTSPTGSMSSGYTSPISSQQQMSTGSGYHGNFQQTNCMGGSPIPNQAYINQYYQEMNRSYPLDWFSMYPGLCNRQNVGVALHSSQHSYPLPSDYSFQANYNSCSVSY